MTRNISQARSSDTTMIFNYTLFHRTELLRLIDELNITGDEIRNSLITSFNRTKDSGIMSAEEAADFVILELSGDVDKSRDLSDELANRAIKKIK